MAGRYVDCRCLIIREVRGGRGSRRVPQGVNCQAEIRYEDRVERLTVKNCNIQPFVPEDARRVIDRAFG